ncbi:hypothetical protein [uncultured Clostridium sp.]|uniref:hypothetical protein n=1 Tax=uncultured Clostridium sp. TaxID=59620 RepID=UPI00280B1734|nr:hypothetical protein [uncultured Clostridium sp.]
MNHAWNYIKINGKYYNLDVTFNDPVPETNKRRDIYFKKSNEEMSTIHTWNKSQYPECNDKSFKFLRSFNSYNIKSKVLKTIDTSEHRIYGLYITDNILNINSMKIDKISLKINEDFNNDSIIDIEDLIALALRYRISKESDNWKHKYDLNLDNIIDIFDITMIAKKL